MSQHTHGSLESNGATEIASAIQRFWRQRGYTVSARVERVVVKGHALFAVRTDLVNGLPHNFAGNRNAAAVAEPSRRTTPTTEPATLETPNA